MPAITWKLARVATGETRTLEAWGIRSAVRTLVNQGRDTLQLGFGGSDLLGNSPLANAETLRLDRVLQTAPDVYEATVIFRGRIIGVTRGAYGSSESFSVTLAGPWWYLENLVYMQQARFVVDGALNPAPVPPETLSLADFATVEKTTSQVVIKEDQKGVTVDSAAQVVDAVNYAIAKGAPLALGVIDPGIAIPRDAITDATCAEIIARALRWTPDQAVFFDYSVDPPALHVRTRANQSVLPLDASDAEIEQVEINPRHDLVVSGVTLNYIRRHARTGVEFTTLDKDQAGPDPEGIGALVMTMELYGSYIVQTPYPETPSVPITTVVAAEALPVGLAAALFAAYSAVPYEGRLLRVQDECDALPWIGKKLSITNGVPAWETAEMIVQQSSDDLVFGRTEFTVGPPRQLGPQDILGLVRQGRTNPPSAISRTGPVQPSADPRAGSTDPRLQFGAQKPPDYILTLRMVPAYDINSGYEPGSFPFNGGPYVSISDRLTILYGQGEIFEQIVRAISLPDAPAIVTIRGFRLSRVQQFFGTLNPRTHPEESLGPGPELGPVVERV